MMTLDEIDKTGLIRESYLIDGISIAECRSVFLDWALKLPEEFSTDAAIGMLLKIYGGEAHHPMTQVLTEGMGQAAKAGRRGGRKGRLGV